MDYDFRIPKYGKESYLFQMSVISKNGILNNVCSFNKSLLNACSEPDILLATGDPGETKSQLLWNLDSSGLEMANNLNMYM